MSCRGCSTLESLVACVVAIGCATGCATSELGLKSEVAGSRDGTAALDSVPIHGALTTVFCRSAVGVAAIAGELLAVENNALWLLDRGTVTRVDRRCITGAIVERHRSLATNTASWTFFGTLSTFGHGSWSGLTVPIWLIAGAAATASQAAGNDVQVQPHQIENLWPFARFPAGRPPRYYRAAGTASGSAVEHFRLGSP